MLIFLKCQRFWSALSRGLSAFVFAILVCTPVLAQESYAGKTLSDVNFLGKDLAGADFSGATLKGVQFSQANLQGAKFEGASIGDGALGPTSFTLANLTNANFSNVVFESETSFEYANISGAIFSNMDARNAIFGPHPEFDHSEKAPDFSGATLTCEHPWFWDDFKLDGATKPACENGLIAADASKIEGEPTEAVIANVANENGQVLPAATVSPFILPTERMQLASDFSRKDTAQAGNSIFVSSTGTDSATCGATSAASCATISTGMTRCNSLGAPCSVLIGYGKYVLPSTLALVNQISLVGGYVGGKPSTYQSTIIAPTGGVPAISAGAGVTSNLQNLIVIGTATTSSAKASVAISIVGTNGITVDTVNVQAGSGSDAGNAPKGAAKNGVNGSAFVGSSTPSKGGASQCGTSNQGGTGATSITSGATCTGNWASGCHFSACSQKTGNAFGSRGGFGQAGGGAGTAPAFACHWDGNGPITARAGNGTSGANASGTAAAGTNRIGSFSAAGIWTPVASGTGISGKDGGGGGGGGSQMPRVNSHCKVFEHCHVDNGAAAGGGGGGSGGCGATGGGGGQMGGATFAIVLANANLNVGADLKVVGAQGGSGGDGGAGVVGGTGGFGGYVIAPSTIASGGNGGTGGASSGGAGGNGGPSVGLVLIGTATYTKGPTSIYPGASGLPGLGGAGVASHSTTTGAKGQSGLAVGTFSTN